MTIHVNIGEAKTRLSKLLAAAMRGEEVVITRDGTPEIRLVPVDPDAARKARADLRRQAFGRFQGQMTKEALDYVAEPSFTAEEMEGLSLCPDDGEA